MKKCIFAVILLIMVLSFSACGEPFPHGEITSYSLNLVYNNDSKTLSGSEKVDYFNSSDNVLNSLEFHLYPNAFRENSKFKPVSFAKQDEAYPNGVSYGHIEIESVKKRGALLIFDVTGEDENILRIYLGEELYPDSRIEIEIEFVSFIPNVHHRFGYGENTVNIANFYPIACVMNPGGGFENSPYSANGDPFYSDMANYEVLFTYPSDMTLAATGEVIGTNKKGPEQMTKLSAKYVRDFALVLSERFKVINTKESGVEVSYFYYEDPNPARSLETAARALKTNNNLFGKYPYKTLNVAESNFIYGGMEYPNLVLISDSISNYDEYLNVIVHEIGHQWWYNLVGSDEYKNAWLDEGLTEFTTAVFYAYNEDYEVTYDQIIYRATENFNMFLNIYAEVFDTVDTSMDRNLNEFKTEPEYVQIVYVKGMLLFDSLKNILGEETFFKCLQKYFDSYKYKNSTPDGLIDCFESESNRELESFFKSWILGKVVFM